jgi:DNA polymerase III epsilon subunit-like protein
MEFVAIDFETANEYRGSVCSVGVVTMVDGQVVPQHAHIKAGIVRDNCSCRGYRYCTN